MRTFHVQGRRGDAAVAANYVPVVGLLARAGERIAVYVDRRDRHRVADATVDQVMQTLDDRVIPLASERWGAVADVDGDGRLTVLVTGWLGRQETGAGGCDGYLRPADFDTRLPAPLSNHCDMIYLDAGLVAGPHLETVLAHEYAHALVLTARAFAGSGRSDRFVEEEGWLDEALAHQVESQLGDSRTNLEARALAHRAAPERYPLVSSEVHLEGLFRDPGHRGAGHRFLSWCVARRGQPLLDRLMTTQQTGVAALEAAAQQRFPDLFRAWTVACFDATRPDLARTYAVSPGAPGRTWHLAPTAALGLVVPGTSPAPIALEIASDPPVPLQVTTRRIAAWEPWLELAAHRVRDRSVEEPENPAAGVRLQLRSRGSQPLRIETIRAIPVEMARDPRQAAAEVVDLVAAGPGIETPLRLEPAQVMTTPAIALPEPPRGPGWRILAEGRDDSGRAVAAWAEIQMPEELALDPGRLR